MTWKEWFSLAKLTEEEKAKFDEEKKAAKERKKRLKQTIVVDDTPVVDEIILPKYKWYDPRSIRFGTCLTVGIISNIFFFLFILILMYYYDLYTQFGEVKIWLETLIWTFEGIGFLLMLFSNLGIVFRVVETSFTKKMIVLYTIVEILIMTFDFKFIEFSWFNAFSKPLIIGHAIFSAFVCFTYKAFDPYSKLYSLFVNIASLICLSGMMWLVFNFQIYLSLLTNCLAYLFLYISTGILVHYEAIEVPCKGDPVVPVETKSIFFE